MLKKLKSLIPYILIPAIVMAAPSLDERTHPLSAPYFQSQGQSGDKAFIAATGAKYCFDGTTCSHSMSWDGSNMNLTDPVSSTSSSTSAAFVCTAASSNIAYKQKAGAYFCLNSDASCTDTVKDVSGVATFSLDVAAQYAKIGHGSLAANNGGLWLGNTAPTTSNYAVKQDDGNYTFVNGPTLIRFRIGDSEMAQMNADGYAPTALTLGTCGSSREGTISRDAAAGGTSGHRTRVCVCTSDGAGTPVYKWQNMVSGTLGTTTTCAD